MSFCKNCGNAIDAKAEICIKCGARVKESKSKTVAILLAIFLSFWTWVYTYKKDCSKFWIGLLISVTLFWLFFIPNAIVWIWAIIDTCTKDDNWYSNIE